MTREELTRVLRLYAKDIKGSEAQEMARMLMDIHEALDAGAEDCCQCGGVGDIDNIAGDNEVCDKCGGAGCISAEDAIRRILGRRDI